MFFIRLFSVRGSLYFFRPDKRGGAGLVASVDASFEPITLALMDERTLISDLLFSSHCIGACVGFIR